MTRMLSVPLFLVGSFLTIFSLAESPEASTQQFEVDVYSPPVYLNNTRLRYPLRARTKGIEGWVAMHYMVDPAGNTYDIEIVDSSGDRFIEKAARNAVEKYKYKPAQYKGEAIHAGANGYFTFDLADQANAWSRKFAFLFRKFRTAAQQADHARMEEYLARLDEVKIVTLFESAVASLMQGSYAASKNDSEGVRQAYERALSLDIDHDLFRKKEQRSGLLLTLMEAQIATGHLRAALNTWEKLEPELSDPQLQHRLADQIAEIQRVIASDKPTSVTGKIDAGYKFPYELAKPSFALSNVVGRLAEAKLYCQNGRVAFAVVESTAYTLKKDLGACTLILVGDPDTTFEIIDGA